MTIPGSVIIEVGGRGGHLPRGLTQAKPEVWMLMHKGIGLDEFNSMTSARAVHALFECCCNVTWAHKVADSRPFASHDELFAMADKQLFALSTVDLERVFETCIHERVEFHTTEELAQITRSRMARMLGPEGGYAAY